MLERDRGAPARGRREPVVGAADLEDLVGADLGRVDLVVDGDARDLAERGEQLAGGARDARADVEDARLAVLGEHPVGAHDVADVGEVAAGVGAAGDDRDRVGARVQALGELAGEVGDRVDRLLARAGVVEGAGVDHAQAVRVGVEAGEQAGGGLRDRVRVLRAQRVRLGRRHGLRRPVLLARADREHDRLRRLGAHGLQQRRAHRDVVGERADRVLPRLPHVRAGGEVVDDVGPRAGDERAGGRGVAQVERRRGRRGDDVVARGLAGGDEVAAGEAGRAGDQDAAAHAARADVGETSKVSSATRRTRHGRGRWRRRPPGRSGAARSRAGSGGARARPAPCRTAGGATSPGRRRGPSPTAPAARRRPGGRARARPCPARSRGARRAPPAARAARAGTGSARPAFA